MSNTNWITDRPPTVEEVGGDDWTITMNRCEVNADIGETIRRQWGREITAWMPRPEPYVPTSTYRPFANADEFLRHFGRPICAIDEPDLIFAVVGAGPDLIQLGNNDFFSWERAFEEMVFADDSTPFGVQIDPSEEESNA